MKWMSFSRKKQLVFVLIVCVMSLGMVVLDVVSADSNSNYAITTPDYYDELPWCDEIRDGNVDNHPTPVPNVADDAPPTCKVRAEIIQATPGQIPGTTFTEGIYYAEQEESP